MPHCVALWNEMKKSSDLTQRGHLYFPANENRGRIFSPLRFRFAGPWRSGGNDNCYGWGRFCNHDYLCMKSQLLVLVSHYLLPGRGTSVNRGKVWTGLYKNSFYNYFDVGPPDKFSVIFVFAVGAHFEKKKTFFFHRRNEINRDINTNNSEK